MDEPFHLHMVSDSTGETVSSVVRSVMSQFEKVEMEEHSWTLVRTRGQMERVLEGIRMYPGIVMYTIIDLELQDALRHTCEDMDIPCVPLLARPMREMSKFLGIKAREAPGRQHELDEEYFARVDAINYTLAHDDGQHYDDLEKADIILVGVSRTSKTPTSVYLSYRGLNVANVPFVSGCPLPDSLHHVQRPFVVGLVISPDRLLQIRKSRLLSLHEDRETPYVDLDEIKAEVLEARRFFNKKGWPVLDVTRKSVEESAATIMQHYLKYKEERKNNGR